MRELRVTMVRVMFMLRVMFGREEESMVKDGRPERRERGERTRGLKQGPAEWGGGGEGGYKGGRG